MRDSMKEFKWWRFTINIHSYGANSDGNWWKPCFTAWYTKSRCGSIYLSLWAWNYRLIIQLFGEVEK